MSDSIAMIEQITVYLKKLSQKDKRFRTNKVSFLAQGEYNQNYLVETEKERFVFRINRGSQLGLDNQIRYEYNALKRLEISNYTPKVYYVDDTKSEIEYGLLIMEFLKGKPLEYHSDLAKAAEIFQNIHSLALDKKDYDTFIVEKHLFQDRIKEGLSLLTNVWDCPHIPKAVKDIFDRFSNKLEQLKTNESYFLDNPWLVICNTEVNSHNFIIGEKHSWLIDWEKPVLSDPSQDITQFLAPTTTLWKQNIVLAKEDIECFFAIYETKFPDKNIRERVRLYNPFLYFRALSWCAFALVEYEHPDNKIVNMDTYKKIKEYLDADFMNTLLKDIL